MVVGLVAAVLAGGVVAAGSRVFANVGVLAAVLGAVAAALLCVLVFVATLRLLAPCAARPALGAAAPCTVGRGGLIMKIAQLLTASTGGIGRHVASIAPRLERRGHQVRVFCPEDTAEAQGFKELGLDVWSLASLRRFIGADLVHAHGLKAGWLGLPIAWMFRVPLVVTWHNAVLGDGLAPAAVRQTLRAVAMGADLTLGASRDLVAQATRLGARNARLSPIAAPALPAAKISRDEQRRALGAAAEDTVILTVSRLAPQKNLGMVLDIAAAVYDRPDLRFVIVGDGPERDTLQRRIAEERLQVNACWDAAMTSVRCSLRLTWRC